jgi:hypothetical protein
MHPQELSVELPAQGARRATGEGSQNGWQQPQRFSARQKTVVVLPMPGPAPDACAPAAGPHAAGPCPWSQSS